MGDDCARLSACTSLAIPYLPDAGGDSAQPHEVARQDRRRWRHALTLLWDMRRFWRHWDVVSCGVAISAFEKGLPPLMRRCWLEPNVISYGAAITSCEKSKSWGQALRLMREMRCFDVDPNVVIGD